MGQDFSSPALAIASSNFIAFPLLSPHLLNFVVDSSAEGIRSLSMLVYMHSLAHSFMIVHDACMIVCWHPQPPPFDDRICSGEREVE